MKKLLILLTLFLANCQLSPSADEVKLDTDAATQAAYKEAWLANTASITKANYYNSFFDWFGGGAFSYPVYFEDGSLWTFWEESTWGDTTYPAGECAYLNLMDVEDSDLDSSWKYKTPLFVNGNTAIVYLPYTGSTSDAMRGALYILQVKNGKLYRTQDAYGFANIKTWDGVTVPAGAIAEVTTQPK